VTADGIIEERTLLLVNMWQNICNELTARRRQSKVDNHRSTATECNVSQPKTKVDDKHTP
jgi:hypothetical protein